MEPLRFAVLGAGFWARYQLAAWRELENVECVAICDCVPEKAAALAQEFNIPHVYDDAEAMLRQERLDFIDIITNVETHARFVHLAAEHKVGVICQKPMAPTLAECRDMVEHCRDAGIAFYSHENWRWQHPLRALNAELQSGRIGTPFRVRIDYICSFPVFDNQPFLKELEQFILTDIGSHILDVARFLCGDAQTLYCRTHRVRQDIKGEDVATVLMEMNGITVTCNMSYASLTEYERFPQTFVFVEGTQGSIELAPDYWVRVTTADGTHSRRHVPPSYDWANPAYDLIHSSIVETNRDLLRALQSGTLPETHAADNLRTMELVFASYASATTGKVITISDFSTLS